MSHSSGRLAAFILALTLIFGLPFGLPAPVFANEPVTIILQGDETPAAIAKTIEALTRDGKAVTVRIAPPKKAGETPAEEANSALDRIGAFWNNFVVAFNEGNTSLPKTALLPGALAKAWAGNLNGASGLPDFARILIVLGLAGCAAYAVHTLSRPWLPARSLPEGALLVHKLMAAAAVLARDLLALLAFWLTARTAVGRAPEEGKETPQCPGPFRLAT